MLSSLLNLSRSLADIPLVCFDTETTGASAAMGDRVIELGMVRLEAGQVVAEMSQLINPCRPLPTHITYITGITADMLVGQPRFSHILPDVLHMLDGAVLLGHNIPFDLSFLAREFQAAGLAIEQILPDAIVADTLRLARRRFGRGGNSLPVLAQRLGVLVDTSHRALADARTTLGVLAQLLEPLGGWQIPLASLLEAQGGSCSIKPAKQSPLPLELQEALDQAAPVIMEYMDADANLSQRTILPRHVRQNNGQLLLVAWCELRQAERTFRLDRIVRLRRQSDAPRAENI